MKFEYEAMNTVGSIVKDTIEANSQDHALALIRSKGLFLTKINMIVSKPNESLTYLSVASILHSEESWVRKLPGLRKLYTSLGMPENLVELAVQANTQAYKEIKERAIIACSSRLKEEFSKKEINKIGDFVVDNSELLYKLVDAITLPPDLEEEVSNRSGEIFEKLAEEQKEENV